MILWRGGVVESVGASWPGAVTARVRIDAPLPGMAHDATEVPALAFTSMVGTPEVGDRVLLNASALARGLGTGGYAMIVAIPERLPADPSEGPGHLVKARYTPMQTMVLGVDEQESPQHDVMVGAADLGGMPVVVADLHSSLPAIVAGARYAAARAGSPMPKIAYVMTDGASLPIAFSRAVDGLKREGWIDTTITTGQSFGGDLEAVTIHTGLLAAKHVAHADVVVMTQGPGNLGSGTPWGFSGIAIGEAMNATSILGGRPIGALRVSGADPRARHRGLSHHCVTAYGKVALRPAELAMPTGWADGVDDGELDATTSRQVDSICEPHGIHRRVDVPADGLLEALRLSPVALSTMGRGLDEDPVAFIAAAAAGVLSVQSAGQGI